MTVSGGTVSSDGTVRSLIGNVANVVHQSNGHYEINFHNNQVAFVVTQLDNFEANTLDNAVIIHSTGNQFVVKTGNHDGDASDRGFSFMSIST